MFSAGGQAPWWVSGLSGFMTVFSAGTFVVWGGIAYQYGVVAIVINMSYGVAAFIVGRFIAGKWQEMKLTSVAEYIEIRFGKSTAQALYWVRGLLLFTTAGALYAYARLLCALVELDKTHILADPATGHLSIPLTTVIFGLVVVIYTMCGGLWAVLMTDVVQFVVLTLSVLLVIPLALIKVGGVSEFTSNMPEGFTSLFQGEYTGLFVAGWIVIHFFFLGGDWQFTQRYMCVPTKKDARKTAYLLGALYIVCPVLWLLPPMIYRVINPDANYEEAYILMCSSVLPAGMMGIVMAAMFSATASALSSLLNVYAGIYTHDFYYRYIKPDSSERHLVWVGRLITVLLGLYMIFGGLIIPKIGIIKFIMLFASLIVPPMVMPFVWGVYSKRIDHKSLWWTLGISMTCSILYKLGSAEDGFLKNMEFSRPVFDLIRSNVKVADIFVGVLAPFGVLSFMEFKNRHKVSEGWTRLKKLVEEKQREPQIAAMSYLPAMIVAFSLMLFALVVLAIAIFQQEARVVMLGFAFVILILSVLIMFLVGSHKKRLLDISGKEHCSD